MKEPAQLRRQAEAAELLRLCEKNLALWDARHHRVRGKLLEELKRARQRVSDAFADDEAVA